MIPHGPYTLPGEPETVAVVIDGDTGEIYDRCFTWESAQNYALSRGAKVVAVANDGYMTIEEAQRLYDSDRANFIDCFGASESL